jgi:TatD family-associated radical SAM protein
MRLDDLLELLRYVKKQHPDMPTRLNTNGLGELENGREFAKEFKGILDTVSISLNASNAQRYLDLTRSKFGIGSYDAMLTFAQHCKPYVPNVVLTIVDHVEGPDEIEKCRKICEDRGLKLRVRPYEDS